MGKESEFEYFTKENRQMATKLMKKKNAQPHLHQGSANHFHAQTH